MATHMFTITMSDEVLAQLRIRAQKQKAPSLEDYVRVLIEKDVETDKQLSSDSNDSVATTRSLADILAPVHQQVEASGISDEELDALFDTLRDEVYKEKQEAKHPVGQTA